MKKLLYIVTLLLSFHSMEAQNKKQQDIATIKASRAASNKAIAAHDIDGISKYWLDDFLQVRGNASYLTGKDAIIATWKELFVSIQRLAI